VKILFSVYIYIRRYILNLNIFLNMYLYIDIFSVYIFADMERSRVLEHLFVQDGGNENILRRSDRYQRVILFSEVS
jgi:hypothetical protein